MDNNSIDIIITVPHSLCLHTYRDCDMLAKKAGTLLYKGLKEKHNTIIMFSNVHRTKLDLNREESRQSSFREELRILLKEENVKMLLDVHSFPNRSLPGEITFLVFNVNNFVYRLTTWLLQNNIDVNIVTASKVNDIILEAEHNNIKQLLIEFNESLTDERLKFIIDKMIQIFNILI